MIILPTRRRLERRRDALYQTLHAVIRHASIAQVEDIMRKIHQINLKLKIYFNRDLHEPEEIFEKDSVEEINIISLDDLSEKIQI